MPGTKAKIGPRLLLYSLAGIFAAAAALYSLVWILYAQAVPAAHIGIDFHFAPHKSAMHIERVAPGGAADQAGLRAGDLILEINGRAMNTPEPYFDSITRGEPGDSVRLKIARSPGRQEMSQIFETTLTLHPFFGRSAPTSFAHSAAIELFHYYPVLFLVVGFGVLMLRIDNPHAWLLAALFSSFIAAVPIFHVQGAIAPSLRPFALSYKLAFSSLGPAFFYFLFAVFPDRSPIDKRAGWLKWMLLAATGAVALPISVWTIIGGSTQPLLLLFGKFGLEWEYTALGSILSPRQESIAVKFVTVGLLFTFGMGLVSLVWNFLDNSSAVARRKLRVILWGTLTGFTPMLLLALTAMAQRRPFYAYPIWVLVPVVLASFCLPLSFAYTVLRHRVLGIPGILRQGARYFLVQRGFVFLIAAVCLMLAVVLGRLFTRMMTLEQEGFGAIQLGPEAALPAGMAVGVGFGILLTWAGSFAERHVTERIDRKFFRSAYDARHILQELAEHTRSVATREELAAQLEMHLVKAFHPQRFAIFLADAAGTLTLYCGTVVKELQELSPETLSAADWQVLSELAASGKPWDVPPMESGGAQVLHPEGPFTKPFQGLAALEPDCLVPILGRMSNTNNSPEESRLLAGLISLGPRRSEMPYSQEDLALLASVANQAGLALQSIQLAEDITQRMEAERRAAVEMKIALEVQSNLFPKSPPPLRTLEYAGSCAQARTVGGDYYDFLQLSPGRVALVLADVAGKGISAALLMSNLQANLRSHSAMAEQDLLSFLSLLNRRFLDAAKGERFVTLFMGIYDDATRSLLIANCGHNAPFLLRRDGSLEKLHATATVMGLFEPWPCECKTLEIAPGDTLVVYSDGVTDAASDDGEMFGDIRLEELIRRCAKLPVSQMLEAMAREVQVFSGTDAEDDLTLLIARGR